MFDADRDEPAYAEARAQLAELLDDDELAAARRTVINAHYTDAAVVQAVWTAVGRLGFTGGDVLEPGSGSGNFIAYAPEGARMVGVELDPTTAAISAALYPDARILAESFADTRAPEGSFDLVVGNVPFGKISLADRRHNPAGHSIHDHFIVKGLHLLRPGGVMAVLTSRYTLDSVNPAARREMAGLADLIGAVRLPSGSMAQAAGTDAVIDVLLLRRRENGVPRQDAVDWETTRAVRLGDDDVRVNAYFLDQPDRILGRLATGGMYRADSLSVVGDRDCAPALDAALSDLVARAEQRDLLYRPDTAAAAARPVAVVAAADRQPERYLQAYPDGTFTQVVGGQPAPYAPPKTQAAELQKLLGLRDTAMRLLETEAASSDDTAELDRLRAALGEQYDAYAAAYGSINRFNLHATGKTDPETGEQVMRRAAPAQGGFRSDPWATLVYALERFDEASQAARKADIFTTRAIAPRAPKLGADTAEDALAICRDVYGELSLQRIAWLLGVNEAEARAQLGTLVFDEPGTDRLLPAAQYLSGDVRAKLAAAQAAAIEDERYGANVDALRAVLPADLTPSDIRVRLGASWVSGATVQQFLRELLDDPTVKVEHDRGSIWDVRSQRKATALATSTWGTERMSAVDIAQKLLEQRPIRVYDVDDVTEKRRLNPDATLAAQAKATELNDRFSDWLWEDEQRGDGYLQRYNTTFNSLVLRSYDATQMSLPGLSLAFKPHPHQYAAVARIVAEPSVGLFHEVGAGKTAEMVMGAMELRRLGLARKPAIIVPNHMREQFTREFLQLYPQANLLAASSEDLTESKRRLFQARVTTGDWDAVILTHRAFEKVAMSPDYQRTYLKAKVAKLEARLESAKAAGQKRLVKQLEAAKSRAEEKIKKKLSAPKDPGLTFEQMGVDYLFVDEAHLFKNLERTSRIPGMTIPGSGRATDLDMKLQWLRESHERVCTLATATPIANSIGEVHTMLMYLAPQLMEQLGIDEFDAWAATFGETVEGIEVMPEGSGLRMNSRFAKFYNVPELLRILHQVSDIKTAEDLDLPVPAIVEREDGKRVARTVVVPQSDEFADYLTTLVSRAEDVRAGVVEPHEDNMLKITHNGRSAALDLRLVPPTVDEILDVLTRYEVVDDEKTARLLAEKLATVWAGDRPNPLDPDATVWSAGNVLDEDGYTVLAGVTFTDEEKAALLAIRSIDAAAPNKLTTAADTIAAIHAEHQADVFADVDGQPHPRPGALQIVFSDLGVPADGFNAYDQLRELLAARGVPREQIRFMHEARNDVEKAQLFAAARDGRIAVLVGSTEKMGVGTNVQARAVALHHLDCPWRPADLQQREGRILRQGNQNAEVAILRYVTEGSFDAYMWQTVSRKAVSISQVLRGTVDVREIEDVGDAALSYNEAKALATGNPLLLDQAALQAEVTRMERLERSHTREQDRLQRILRQADGYLDLIRDDITQAAQALTRRVDTTGDKFAITVLGTHSTDRKQANDLLRAALTNVMETPGRGQQEIATIGGFTVVAESRWSQDQTRRRLFVDMPGLPRADFELAPKEVPSADIANRLEKRLRGIGAVQAQLQRDLAARLQEIERTTTGVGQPFKHADALRDARSQLEVLTAQIEESSRPEPTGPAEPDPTAAAGPAVPARRVDPAVLRTGPLGRPDGNDTDEVLLFTAAAIQVYGWASRRDSTASDGQLAATATIVDTALNGEGYDAAALREELEQAITDDTRQLAQAARAYAAALPDDSFSDYTFQLRTAAAHDEVPSRQFGVLASAVNAYQRHQNDLALQQATPGSQWQGQRGERLDFDAEVLAVRTYSTERRSGQGATSTLLLADTEGNLYSWRAPTLHALAAGTFVHVTGTVKEHADLYGHPQTNLSRCKVSRIDQPADAPHRVPASTTDAPESAVEAAAGPAATAPQDTAAPAVGEPAVEEPERDTREPVPAPEPARDLPPAIAVDRITLDDWIAGHDADLTQLWSGTAADQAWIEDHLTALANDPWVQTYARARRDVEEFRFSFDDDLTNRLIEGLEANERDGFLQTYFSRDPQFRDSLTDFAARTIYDTCRNPTPAPDQTAADRDTIAADVDTAADILTPAPLTDTDEPSPDEPLDNEHGDDSMVDQEQDQDHDQVEEAAAAADEPPWTDNDPADSAVPDLAPDPAEGTGPTEASEAAGVDHGAAEQDPAPSDRRGEVLAAIHRLAEHNRTGMVLHVDGREPQPVDRIRATELFSLMIDRVQENGSVPAQLRWNGVPIGVHRSAAERLQILVGPTDAQVDIPLRHAWPPIPGRAELLNKLVSYINTSGERAEAARQSLRPSARPATERADHVPPAARHAFPTVVPGSTGSPFSRAGTSGPDMARTSAAHGHRR